MSGERGGGGGGRERERVSACACVCVCVCVLKPSLVKEKDDCKERTSWVYLAVPAIRHIHPSRLQEKIQLLLNLLHLNLSQNPGRAEQQQCAWDFYA